MTTPHDDYSAANDLPLDGATSANDPINTPAPLPETTYEQKKPEKVRGSLAGGTWVALIFGILLLIVLLIFILQNQQKVELNALNYTLQFPAGVGFLIAAIIGALIMALVGGVRMLELRRQLKKARR